MFTTRQGTSFGLLSPENTTPETTPLDTSTDSTIVEDMPPQVAKKDPKIPKFDGKTIQVEDFIKVFERFFSTLSEDDRINKLVEYIDGDVFEFYSRDICGIQGITWDQTKEKLIQRFAHSEIDPVTAAIRRRLTRSDTIRQYYDDKMKLLRRSSVPESEMSSILTVGLPDSYKSHFYGKRFKTVGEWLQLAQDIEADMNTKTSSHRTAGSSHFTQSEDKKTNRFSKSNKTFNKNRSPPDCQICKQIGIAAKHWHRDCPNQHKKSEQQSSRNTDNASDSHKPEQSSQSSLNNASHFTRIYNMSTQEAGNAILMDAQINRYKFKTFIDPGSTVDIMPLRVAKQLHLYIYKGGAMQIKMASGVTKSFGSVTFKLTIDGITKIITAQVIKGFDYTLLLSLPTCGLFKIMIDTERCTATTKVNQCHFMREVIPKTSIRPQRKSISKFDKRSSNVKQNTSTQENPHPESNGYSPVQSGPHEDPLLISGHHKTDGSNTNSASPDISDPHPSGRDSHDVPDKTNELQSDITPQSIETLLQEFSHIFASDSTDLGRIEIEYHRILLTDNQPTAQRPYRQSYSSATEVARQTKELLAKGLIRESTSPYAAPVTLPDKKDGTKRLAIDYRRLNSKTISDKTPIPLIADIIDRFRGAKYFSKLDFASGFWQVPIHPDDIHKTAFVTTDGHFEWTVLPFGLKNSPATFHRVVRKILSDLINNGVLSYLDDIIIYASTEDEHHSFLREVFKRLSAHNARLKRQKCEFFRTEIEFLGHLINGTEVKPPPAKVNAITGYPAPKDQKELQRFMGLLNYLREYIPDFSIIAEPLTYLLKKDREYIWTSTQQQSFDEFKRLLSSTPVRNIYDPHKDIELHCDASTVGLAGILLQDGHPIGYYSRKLIDAETRYFPTELECLAVVDSIKFFRIYLEGTQFKIVTDHKALKWLINFESTKKRLYRWSQYLSLYTFDVLHRAGSRMQHVDALSRAPACLYIDIETIKERQQQDSNSGQQYTPVVKVITNASQITDTVPDQLPTDDVSNRLPYTVNNTELQKVHRFGKEVILLPPSLVLKLLTEVHDNSGHPGTRKVYNQIKRKYFWPNMYQDIQQFIKSCHSCQLVKTASHSTFGKLQPLPTPEHPLELISMDTMVLGSSAAKSKAKYLQVILDHHSRYVWAKPTPTNTAEAAISALQDVVRIIGTPQRILTDNGTNFKSRKFLKFLSQHNIKRTNCTPYHPQCNGASEKVNDTIAKGLRIETLSHPRHKWSTLVPIVVNNYNNTIHDITGFTPSYLLLGTDKIQTDTATTETLASDRKLAQQKSDSYRQQKKIEYDRKHAHLELQIRDLVKRRIASNHPDLKKLSPRYDAIFEVVSTPSPVNALIQPYRTANAQPFLVHVGNLEPYFLRNQSSDAGE